MEFVIRRQMLTHFPTLLKVLASSQSRCSILIAIANAIAIVIAIADSPSQMLRLEAYTFSNRDEVSG